ncbi:MAG: hypothetical protein IKV03_02795 [Alphaproteobacteria bacterium]|nr:hypothetical protein [Alphaproteobacteria bacterium]
MFIDEKLSLKRKVIIGLLAVSVVMGAIKGYINERQRIDMDKSSASSKECRNYTRD